MPLRTFGTLTKITVEEHSEVLQAELGSDEVDPLSEPISADIDGPETTAVDEVLIGYDFGNGVRPEEPPLSPSDTPLPVDIDDGRTDPPRNRLGVLKRVSDAPRVIQKFNRHTESWE